jgi:predicted MPP superfamily phosphohydrolase
VSTAAGDREAGAAAVPGAPPRRGLPGPFLLIVITVLLLLHGLPWWRLVVAPQWSAPVTAAGTIVAFVALVGFPFAMMHGHGRRASDRWARIGDIWLGIIWVVFSWTVIGELADLVLLLAGMPTPERQRIVASAVLVVAIVLCCWGNFQARRVPPIRRTEITLDRMGAGLDGLTIVLIADTHYGPINRAVWSAKMVAAVNRLNPDVIVHAGDLADGSVDRRRAQVAPLGSAQAGLARVYITGNHEYFSGAVEWVEHMTELGWTVLHNRHIMLERGGSSLAIAGTDDLTAAGSGIPGHRSDLPAALAGIPAGTPVVLVAHQPKEVREAAAAGVDLQLSGHTHGGQIWPFHLIVRVEQGALQGLSRSGLDTQLYTTRGVGFWGPPFRVFAPNEISLLTLRSGAGPI